jgi:predicted nucleic acid-binding protein
MTVLCFVDTNILLYAHDRDAGIKSQRSAELLRELWESETGVLSVQVLQEFYVNVTQKIPTPIAKAKAREVVRLYGAWLQTLTPVESVLRASEISEIWQLSFWDSLIIAAAEQVSAAVVLSEDLHHGQTIGGVRIINPLLSSEPLEQLIQ